MFTVRTMTDGELTQPLEQYATEQEALERMDDLLIVVGPDTHVDVYDESGYVIAAQYVGMESA